MNLSQYLSNHKLNEDAVGTTSGALGPVAPSHGPAGGPTISGDISYVPSQLGRIQKGLTQLSKRRKPQSVRTIKGPKQTRVVIGESLIIDIQNHHWDLFKKEVFENKEPSVVDLSAYLNEALSTEVNIAMNKLKERFIALLNEPVFVSQRRKISGIVKDSGDTHLSFNHPDRTLISEPSTEGQVNYFISIVNKAYANNLGEIEILTHHITNRLPLSSITLFRNLDNLSGNILRGEFLGQPFIFSTIVDLNYELTEYLQFQSEDLTNRFKTHPGFKVAEGTIWPTSEDGFKTDLSSTIKKFIQGVPDDSTRK